MLRVYDKMNLFDDEGAEFVERNKGEGAGYGLVGTSSKRGLEEKRQTTRDLFVTVEVRCAN